MREFDLDQKETVIGILNCCHHLIRKSRPIQQEKQGTGHVIGYRVPVRELDRIKSKLNYLEAQVDG